MPDFVLNDEKKVNSYGFNILNAGISLNRFLTNPVMLDSHDNCTDGVIGKWLDPHFSGSQLIATPEFDKEDEDAMKIAGKVDRGYIKGASLGITFNWSDMESNDDGTYTLTKCEVLEGSIVGIPSNANAVRLYAEPGVLMQEGDIQLGIQKFVLKQNRESSINQKTKTMTKINLSAVTLLALGIANTEDGSALTLAIESKMTELSNLKAENTELKNQMTAQTKLQATTVVDQAIKEGKLSADQKDAWVEMGVTNLKATMEALGSIPVKASLKKIHSDCQTFLHFQLPEVVKYHISLPA